MRAGKKMAAAVFLVLILVFIASMPAQMTEDEYAKDEVYGSAAQKEADIVYTQEEKVAAVWIDFLIKRLKYPDSLQISDIIVRGRGESASLEIIYRAKNGYGETNTKSMTGSLYRPDCDDCGSGPFLVLPDGRHTFPSRMDPGTAGRRLNILPDKRLDIGRVRRLLLDAGIQYQYHDGGDEEDAFGWREEDERMNEAGR